MGPPCSAPDRPPPGAGTTCTGTGGPGIASALATAEADGPPRHRPPGWAGCWREFFPLRPRGQEEVSSRNSRRGHTDNRPGHPQGPEPSAGVRTLKPAGCAGAADRPAIPLPAGAAASRSFLATGNLARRSPYEALLRPGRKPDTQVLAVRQTGGSAQRRMGVVVAVAKIWPKSQRARRSAARQVNVVAGRAQTGAA